MDIKTTIIKSAYTTLDASEQDFLDSWLKEGNNKRLYDRIVSNLKDSDNYLFEISEGDISEAWENVRTRIAPKRERRWARIAWRTAAAIASIIIIGAGTTWYTDYTRITPPILSEDVTQAIKQSIGTGKADNLLSEEQPITSPTQQSTKAKDVSSEQLMAYQLAPDETEQLLDPKMVETVQGKESWVKLDDGTIVHLGKNSRVIYPEHFRQSPIFGRKAIREVIVEGQAYFMVAHDKSRPFVVHTRNGDIIDYGTEFFVNALTNHTQVALISGKIGVKTDTSGETILTPGQEAKIEGSGKYAIHSIDTERYVAWNTGKYTFHEIPARQLINIISMWYGRKIQFDETISDLTVSGVFYKYANEKETLESLSLALGGKKLE